ncbi:Pyruvate:ferredoxin oxidoreductase, gamma subunit [invertebrate metagenome]|uniref:Pyruvate:ferredoxin oxidoreductase, gamma subunit n=1 Tax=invertebrate metagenome TaxID=1711999 RepID=A0A484H4W2_9ZZZZ
MVAAYLLASAAFEVGRYCQAFPNFGAERRGAPVMAFVRIDVRPILRRSQVRTPAFLIIQDPGLLNVAGVLDGLQERGGVLVNSSRSSEELSRHTGKTVVAFAATHLALQITGKPLANVALLSAFASLTGLLSREALVKALSSRFKDEVLAKNLKLVDMIANQVPSRSWKEIADALST